MDAGVSYLPTHDGHGPAELARVMEERGHRWLFWAELTHIPAPKPVQKPHPPILVGGNGPTVRDRVLDYGDAWMPNHGSTVAARIGELRERADRSIEVVVMGPSLDASLLEKYEAAGADRVLFWLPSGRRSVIEAELERIEGIMSELDDVGLG